MACIDAVRIQCWPASCEWRPKLSRINNIRCPNVRCALNTGSGGLVIYFSSTIRSSADEHAQTSVSEHRGRHSPRPAGGPDGAEQHAGLPGLDTQPSGASIRLPGGAARKVSAPVRRAHIPDTCAAPGPGPGTCKDPDPRRQSSRGSGAQNRPACPAMTATRRPRAVPSQRLPGAMVSGAHAVL
jgi:hypothetical protein